MTDEERKAWEELVVRGIKDIGVQVHGEYMDQVILAADAELKRLREAVEWAIEHPPIGLVGFPNMTMPEIVTWWRNELRRKVKEG